MPYRGPSVLPQPLDLGGAISGGLDRFLQARQLKREKDLQAYQTGFGVQWPTPETTQAPSVSIMGTATAAPPTQTAPSAPLPGVAGLPSPGRVQPMNITPMAPGGNDLGPALQTGQQRQIGGVAQPHDDLRDAIASAGGNDPSIMHLAGQSYIPPPMQHGGGSDPNAMVTLPSGRQVPFGMTPFGRQIQQFQIENYLKGTEGQKNAALALKDLREANTPRFGDANYDALTAANEGAKAGAIAGAQWQYKAQELQAQLENNLAVQRARGATEEDIAKQRIAGEQLIANARLAFEGAQGDLNRKNVSNIAAANRTATTTNQATAQTAARRTHLEGIHAAGDNSIVTSLGRKVGLLNTPPTPQQADYDDAVEHLKTTQPGADPTTVLGPRP